MKWFFALNEQSPNYDDYCRLIKVAVYTAYLHTSLQPFFIYDGQENDLTQWLRQRNVQIIHHRTRFYTDLKNISESTQREWILSMGAGAFLRIDLPKILYDLGVEDKYVLYTDTDVMFLEDVTHIEEIDCPFFAVAPEIDIEDNVNINTGVMLMNIPNLLRDDQKFSDFTNQFLLEFASLDWDQTAYRTYYHMEWNTLNPVYNWKPYWGADPTAKILHFHGLKPTVVENARSGNLIGRAKDIAGISGDEYYRQVDIWERFLTDSEQLFQFIEDHPIRREFDLPPIQMDNPLDDLRDKMVHESLFSGLCESPSRCDWRAVKGKLVLWILAQKYDASEIIKAYLALSRFFVLLGILPSAIFHAQVAYSLDPNTPSTIVWLGELHFRQGNVSTAIATIEDGLEKNPNNLELILALARMHQSLQDYETSFRYYQRAEKISPQNPSIAEGLTRLSNIMPSRHIPK